MRQKDKLPGCLQGVQCIGCGGEGLAWRKGGVEIGAAACPHTDFQVARVAVKGAGTKVELHGEHAFGHGDAFLGDGAADLDAIGQCIVQLELEIVRAAGGGIVVRQPALIGEGCAQRGLRAYIPFGSGSLCASAAGQRQQQGT